jgi:murein L,D-transpeptidase YafK
VLLSGGTAVLEFCVNMFRPLCLFSLASISVLVADKPPATAAKKAVRIVVEKSTRTMKLMLGSEILKTCKVALSTEPVGAKEREGDHKVPEGHYVIDSKNSHSRFHLALHVSYPNAADRKKARTLGVKPGGDIEIHGLGSKYGWVGSLHLQSNWTDGCIAVTNAEIEEIWPLVVVGTPLEIRP